MDIMAARNLDNTGCGCQTLLDDPKLLGRGPPPSPLRTRQNRNRRHVLLICLQINEQTISRSNTVQEGGPYRGLTIERVFGLSRRDQPHDTFTQGSLERASWTPSHY
jgi:hypothetical protein